MKKNRMKTGGGRLWFRLSALAVAGILVLLPVLVSLCGTGEISAANVYASERIEGGENAGVGSTSAAEIAPAGGISGGSSETSAAGGSVSAAEESSDGGTSAGGSSISTGGSDQSGDSSSGDGQAQGTSGSGGSSAAANEEGDSAGGGSTSGGSSETSAGGGSASAAEESSDGSTSAGGSDQSGHSSSGDKQAEETSGRSGSSAAAKEERDSAGGGSTSGGSSKTSAGGSDKSGDSSSAGGRTSDSASAGSGSSDNSSTDKTGDSSSLRNQSPGEKSDSGKKEAGAPGDSSGTAPAGASDGTEDQAASGTGEVLEEDWMTVGEFEQAFESVTEGAAGAASTLSDAKVVSKRNELDYEELGIGEETAGTINHTTPIDVEDGDGNGYFGVCVSPNDRGWPRGTVLPNVKRVTDAVMIKLYYYTVFDNYGKQLASSRGYGGNAEDVSVCACHEAMSQRYSELAGVEYDRPNLDSDFKSLVSAYRSGISSKEVPDQDKVYVYISARVQDDGHWMQAYVFGRIEEDEPANIVLMKTCSDPDMRPRYTAYSLSETAEGKEVVFRLFSDKDCTRQVKVYKDAEMTTELSSIPVGANGNTGLTNRTIFYCEPGTYYVKEMNVPMGYQPHPEPFGPFTFEEGKGKTIKLSNTPRYGLVAVLKKDAKTGKGLEGAVFNMYTSKEDARNNAAPEGRFVTGKDGRSNTLPVLLGKGYYVREVTAPEGYELSEEVRLLRAADTFIHISWTEIANEAVIKEGRVRVKKISGDPEAVGSPYSLEGAEYTLYDSDGKEAGRLKTGKDGISDELTVLCGNYTLKETKASPGFELDIKTYDLTVTEDKLTTVESTEEPKKGKITLVKHSSEEKDKKEADTMPIAGAVYGLYKTREDAEEMRSAAGTFVVQADGSSNVIEVLAGRTWYIRETKTPEGYLPDEQIHEAKVVSFAEVVTVRSEDKLIFGGVKACKLDLETGEGRPLGGATLEGAVFRIFNDGDRSVYAGGRKVLPGAEALTLETDAEGVILTEPRALSYGTYRIEEVSPPDGYTMNGAKAVRFSIREDGAVVDLTGNTDTSIKNQIMRGDISIRKLDSYTQRKMAGVTFEVTALDSEGKEIEKHRFTTDRNGFFDSTAVWAYARKNSENPVGAGEPADTEEEEAQSGRIWFGEGTEPSDSMGALPYGDYIIEEIEGENNRGRKMFSDRFSVYADRQMIMLGNIENTMKPALGTELEDEDGDHYADKNGTVTLTDTVAYGGMEEFIGREIVFHGVIYVKETGQPLVIGGHKVEAVRTKKILSPAGTVKLRFTFDASQAEGMTLVCYEYASELPGEDEPGGSQGQEEIPDQAWEGETGQTAGGSGDQASEGEAGQNDQPGGQGGETAETGTQETDPAPADPTAAFHDSTNGGKDIASHTDPEDEAQTVRLVSVETDAEDEMTGTRTGLAREGAVTVDHVTCKGLIPGYYYQVTGTLVDKSSGLPLRDGAGKQVEAHASFRADKEEQTVDLTFTYDASALEGTTVVAFEKLYLKGREEPDDPDEPGPDDPIAVHEDPDDEDQSIHYPSIRTFASAKDGETKTFTVGQKLVLQDRVTWKNLIPGKTYLLRGSLMRKDSGKAFEAEEKAVTAQTSFTPGKAEGETILDFTFDSSALLEKESKETNASAGNTAAAESMSLRIVAFEELYLLSSKENEGRDDQPDDSPDAPSPGTGSDDPDPEEELLVAEHKDLEDSAQTVLLRGPEEPEEPSEPQEPEEPSEPEKPQKTEKTRVTEKEKEYEKITTVKEKEKTETAGGSRKKVTPASPETVRGSGSPRTGDESGAAVFALVMLLAAGIVAFLLHSGMSEKKAGKKREPDSDGR